MMTLNEIEVNIRTLAKNKRIMAEQVGAARDLMAELLMSYETLCDLQAREYIRLHKAVKAEVEDEQSFNFDLENMKRAVESPTALTLTGNLSQEEILEAMLEAVPVESNTPYLQKFVRCKHWDCGYCYASSFVKTNAINGGCFKPQECPANKGD